MDIALVSAETIGIALALLCFLAATRGDSSSLRNWLILTLVYDVLVVMGLLTIWKEVWERDTDFRVVIGVWFLWQPILWWVWRRHL